MYITQIVTQDEQTITYTGLAGTLEQARKSGIELFTSEHPGRSIKDSFVFTEQEYHGIHKCRDSTGRGCCDVCGGVIAGSPLYREINGGD